MCGVGCNAPALLGRVGQQAEISTCGALIMCFLGICAVGLAIKLMDDFLDSAIDEAQSVHTPAQRLGNASLPYALACFGVGALVTPKLTSVLFFSAYGVGMAGDFTQKMPSGLKGYQEGLLATGIGYLGAGPIIMTWALMMIVAIQALDDLTDMRTDLRSGGHNWCHRYGLGEVILGALLAAAISVALSFVLTALTLLATTCINFVCRPRQGTVMAK